MARVVGGASAILAVEANLWEVHRDFARVPGAEIHDEPGLLWYTAPSRSSWLNGASRTNLTGPEADEAIRHVVDTIHPLGRNVMWHVGASARPSDLAERLEHAGFKASAVGIGMTLPLDRVVRPPQPEDLDLREGRDEADLLDWLDAFGRAFQSKAPTGRDHPWFVPFGHLALGDGPCRIFVARVDGRAVACSLALVGAGAVGLYGVGTDPEARGRGYGSAVTQAGIDWGREQGADLAILHATEMGEPVYRRLGFEAVTEVTQWVAMAPES